MKFSQHQKILIRMCRLKGEQEWFRPYDFTPPRVPLNDVAFVGYEAGARFAELGKRYPDMIESVHDGKYKKRRIRWEAMDEWLWNIPKDLRFIFHRYGLTKGRERPQKYQAPSDDPAPEQPTEALELFPDVEKLDMPVHKRMQQHPTPREMRAVGNFVGKGYRVEMSRWPKYTFTNKDSGEVETLHISELLAEYDQDRRDEARARASAARLAKRQEASYGRQT